MQADQRSNSSKNFEALRIVLAQMGWDTEPDEQQYSFFIDFGPPYVPISDAIAAVTADAEAFLFYVNFGVLAPLDRRNEVAQFLVRANWALSIGNFEMDYNDGHLRFKSSVNIRDVELTETLIRNAVLCAMHAVEAYANALVSVARGSINAEQAIESVEAGEGF